MEIVLYKFDWLTDYFLTDIGNALSKKYNVRFILPRDDFEDSKNTIFITFNGHGIERVKEANVFDIYMDHPYIYLKKNIDSHPKNYFAFFVDKEHLRIIKEEHPEINSYFLPLAGRIPSCERSINQLTDVCFVGSIRDKETRVSEKAKELIKVMLETYDDSYTVFKKLHPNESINIPVLYQADRYCRDLYRRKAIETVVNAGFKTVIIGCGWNAYDFDKPVTIFKEMSNLEAEKFQCASKFAINVLPWFKNGPHDRIYTSILCDAVVLTDKNEYLEKEFKNKESILFYDRNNMEQIPELLNYYIKNEEERFKIYRSGKKLVSENDTWLNRIYILEEVINGIICTR